MEKKHALITGATSGIGYELAKLFAQNGYSLVLVARNEDNLNDVAAELEQLIGNIHTHIIAADIFEKDAAQKVYDKTTRLCRI